MRRSYFLIFFFLACFFVFIKHSKGESKETSSLSAEKPSKLQNLNPEKKTGGSEKSLYRRRGLGPVSQEMEKRKAVKAQGKMNPVQKGIQVQKVKPLENKTPSLSFKKDRLAKSLTQDGGRQGDNKIQGKDLNSKSSTQQVNQVNPANQVNPTKQVNPTQQVNQKNKTPKPLLNPPVQLGSKMSSKMGSKSLVSKKMGQGPNQGLPQRASPLNSVDENKNVPSTLFPSERKKSIPPLFQKVQELNILNTAKGFTPSVVRVFKNSKYKINVVNVNRKSKNASFILSHYSIFRGTYFGDVVSFDIQPKYEGIYSFQCPETGEEGWMLVLPEKVEFIRSLSSSEILTSELIGGLDSKGLNAAGVNVLSSKTPSSPSNSSLSSKTLEKSVETSFQKSLNQTLKSPTLEPAKRALKVESEK